MKKILIGILIDLVLITSFVSAFCTDSDGGIDLLNKGTLEIIGYDGQAYTYNPRYGNSYTDSCQSDGRIAEHSCDEAVVSEYSPYGANLARLYECPDGKICSNGACIDCVESWSCSSWLECIDSLQTRTCNDANNCGTLENKPSESQSCVEVCIENWQCTEWSECKSGKQARTCLDSNSCGTADNKPETSKSCSCIEDWLCTSWSDCVNNKQTRTCTDSNSCGTTKDKPTESKSCCEVSWQCGSWSECINGKKTRTCTDVNSCSDPDWYKDEKDCIMADECEVDSDCDDNDISTTDSCSGTPKKCSNTKITECKTGDNYCPTNCNYEQDKDCPEPGECSTDSDCDDNDACTTDRCAGTPKKCSNQKTGSGCDLNGNCVPIGTRTENKYCDVDNSFKNQKIGEGSCDNNYECSSNICVNNQCIEANFIQKIIEWFKRLFGMS